MRPPETVRTPPPDGLRVRVVVDGPSTSGAYGVLEVLAPTGTVIPAHVSARHTETVMVLAGEVEAVVGADRRLGGAGDVLHLARGVPSRLVVRADARLLCLVVPAGIERLAGLATEPPPEHDDVVALLAVLGVDLLPRTWNATATIPPTG